MQVKRVNEIEFERMSLSLAQKTLLFEPDILIGIESGGVFLMNKMRQTEVFDAEVIFDSISIKRKSSNGVKKLTWIVFLVGISPEWLIKIARKVEMVLSETISKFKIPDRILHRDALSDLTLARIKKGCRILIVDDAVDTGKTLDIALVLFKEKYPKCIINTAVLTITHKNPILLPDFFLFKRVILQFPWSLDKKK